MSGLISRLICVLVVVCPIIAVGCKVVVKLDGICSLVLIIQPAHWSKIIQEGSLSPPLPTAPCDRLGRQCAIMTAQTTTMRIGWRTTSRTKPTRMKSMRQKQGRIWNGRCIGPRWQNCLLRDRIQSSRHVSSNGRAPCSVSDPCTSPGYWILEAPTRTSYPAFTSVV